VTRTAAEIPGFRWGELEERKPGRPRSRWEYNIKMDLSEIEWEGLE